MGTDCGSFSGTYLNCDRVEEMMLEDSGELRIGRFTFVFYAPRQRRPVPSRISEYLKVASL